MIGRWYPKIVHDWLPPENPLALWLSLQRAKQPFAHPSSYLVTSLPRHPFLRLSRPPSPEKKGYVPDNGTEPIRSVREDELTELCRWSCASAQRFLIIIISTRLGIPRLLRKGIHACETFYESLHRFNAKFP